MNNELPRGFEDREMPTLASTPSARRMAAAAKDVSAASSRYAVVVDPREKLRRLPRAS